MSQPSVIGSGQSHTVTLAPGSQTAAHRQPRPAAPTQEVPAPRAATSSPPQATQPRIASPAASAQARALEPAAPEPDSILSSHILQRINSLKERNDLVRAEMDAQADPRRTP